MDHEGFVHISPEPGLGLTIDRDYINKNLVDRPGRPAIMGQTSRLPRTNPPASPNGRG
jgi:hypothetical protein